MNVLMINDDQSKVKLKLKRYWVLRAVGDNFTLRYATKHIALSSIEMTYPGALYRQTYLVNWIREDMGVIIIEGCALYTLTEMTEDVIEIVPAKIPVHKDAPIVATQPVPLEAQRDSIDKREYYNN